MSAATSPWPVPASAPASSRVEDSFTPGRLPQGLIERLFDLCKRANVHAFLADFDKRNLKRIRGDEAVRALSAAGLAVDKADEVPIRDVAAMVAEAMGFTGRLVMDASKADGQFKKTAANGKLRALLPGYTFKPIREGIAETVAWFKANYDTLRK